MKLLYFILLIFSAFSGLSQEITNSVSIGHYAHPDLYLKAGVVCFVADKQGNPTRDGSYLFINNQSSSSFYYNSPGKSNQWKTVRPNQKVLLTVAKGANNNKVPLRVKYTKTSANNSREKISDLKLLNAISGQAADPKPETTAPTSKPVNLIKPKNDVAVKPKPIKNLPDPTTSTSKKPVKALAVRSNKPKLPVVIEPVPSNCMNTAAPAYYTFYYLKVNKEVFYSDVFPVAEYTDTDEGEELLSQAWNCFLAGFRAKYNDEKVDKFLNDPDNDLQLGLTHLRDPFIPSKDIRKKHPYTATPELARQELKRWIAYESFTYRGLTFVKINLSEMQ